MIFPIGIPDIVRDKIERFIKLLEADNFRIQKAILLVSYESGKVDDRSDIDLAVISDSFRGDGLLDMLDINERRFKSSLDISPLPFRPEDFANSMFARDEIAKKGIGVL